VGKVVHTPGVFNRPPAGPTPNRGWEGEGRVGGFSSPPPWTTEKRCARINLSDLIHAISVEELKE
jgi:hypothetical protein